MSDFKPTHRITLADGEEILVALCDDNGDPADYAAAAGPAYTEQEWRTGSSADYERHSDGSWTCQGKAFEAVVIRAVG